MSGVKSSASHAAAMTVDRVATHRAFSISVNLGRRPDRPLYLPRRMISGELCCLRAASWRPSSDYTKPASL